MRRLLRWLLALVLLRHGARGRERPAPAPDARRREVPGDRGAANAVAALLIGAWAAAAAFIVFFFAADDTQLLGLALGLALALLSAACIVAGARLVPQETAVEERPEPGREAQVPEEVEQIVRAGGHGVSRRGLVAGAAGATGATLGFALLLPATSLGPRVGDIVGDTPWRRGRRLVDTDGEPLRADDIEEGLFYTALPGGADRRALGAGLVVVRLAAGDLALPAERRAWAPEGILAYSKICPHAGCAISIYRHPLNEPTSSRPALVCPCHYSTFDPARGGKLLFGPAGRNLPQLPLQILADRALAAAADFPEQIGPSFSDIERGPS